MKKHLLFILTLLLFVFAEESLLSQKQLSPVAESLKASVETLTSEDFQGRLTGEPGNYKAADFIENFFKSKGLQPLNGSYRNEFSYNAGVRLNPDNNVSFQTLIEKVGLPKEMWTKAVKKWNVNEDWFPVKFSENGTVTGELVFAGFGITAKEINYDDYDGIDVKGKVVIVLSDSTDGIAKESRFANYGELKYKATNAKDHGAVGIIFVKMLSDSANTFYPLKGEANIGNGGIAAIQANRTKIATFFPRNQALYTTELEIIKTKKTKSFAIPNTKVTINVNLGLSVIQVPNVVGIVKGTDAVLSDEYIVLGAHFDHLGYGPEKSKYKGKFPKLHPGADDNASGVSVLLETATRIAKNPLKRTVVFVAFNAEEEGVLGSMNFLKSNAIPASKISAMVNLDMVGRMKDNKVFVFGVGTSSKFTNIVDETAKTDTVTVVKVEEGYSPSDHSSFYTQKIPVLFLFTGVHLDYHTPADEADKLNYSGMEKVSRYVESIMKILGNQPEKPDFKQNESPSEGSTTSPSGTGYGSVWFGIVPNFEPDPNGFKIQGTSPGSPAEKAGLLNGDILVTMGGNKIKNIKDLSTAIKSYKPGDKVPVTYLRDGKEKKVEVTMVKK